jgi:hypothetical protein
MIKKIALATPGGYHLNSVGGMPEGGQSTLQKVIDWGITALLFTAVILSLYFLIFGGIQWIMSAGDKTKIESARKKMIYAVIGLIVVLSTFMIINIVGSLFGVTFFS